MSNRAGLPLGFFRDSLCRSVRLMKKVLRPNVCPQARVGDLRRPAPDARRGGRDCLLESDGVRSLVVEKLGVVIDTGKCADTGLIRT